MKESIKYHIIEGISITKKGNKVILSQVFNIKVTPLLNNVFKEGTSLSTLFLDNVIFIYNFEVFA